MRTLIHLSWLAMALAATHAAVGIAMSLVGNPGGWFGGILYALMYAVPLLLIALALRSSHSSLHAAAGWVALVLGAFYSLVVAGNWSGYSSQMAVFAVCITVPTAALDLVIFWAAVLRRSARPATTRS
jgi:hypothetical protein